MNTFLPENFPSSRTKSQFYHRWISLFLIFLDVLKSPEYHLSVSTKIISIASQKNRIRDPVFFYYKIRPKAGRRLWLWPVEHCPVTARLSFAFEKEVTNFLLISLAFCRIISAVKFRLSRRDFPQRLFSSPQSEVHSVAFSNRLAGARPTVMCNRVTKRSRQQSKLIPVTNY